MILVIVACETAILRASELVEGLPSFSIARMTSNCGPVRPDSFISFFE